MRMSVDKGDASLSERPSALTQSANRQTIVDAASNNRTRVLSDEIIARIRPYIRQCISGPV